MLAPVHNRMPVMLSDDDAIDWLSGSEIDHAISLLKPFSADLMDGYDVSKLVNSPLNNTPECVRRFDTYSYIESSKRKSRAS